MEGGGASRHPNLGLAHEGKNISEGTVMIDRVLIIIVRGAHQLNDVFFDVGQPPGGGRSSNLILGHTIRIVNRAIDSSSI